jgi:polar amino acid transport system substrate-binding protein
MMTATSWVLRMYHPWGVLSGMAINDREVGRGAVTTGRRRLVIVVTVFAALVSSACTQASTPNGVMTTAAAREVRPADVQEPAVAPSTSTESTDCGDPRASLRPSGPLPVPGNMPPGSAMEQIVRRGSLVAGVNQNAYRVGYRDPDSGDLAGFEIDIVREIARGLFGDPGRVRFIAINASNRAAMLQRGEIDLAVRTTTMTCENWRDVAFSTEYYTAGQRLLVRRGEPVTEIEQLGGRKICAATGSTSITNIPQFSPGAVPVSAPDVIDCLVMLQQHQIDAISTSDILLMALAAQDANTQVVGRPLKVQPYGVSVAQTAPDLVRFVNGVLQRMRADGTWTAAYTRWLSPILGPPPPPPPARYRDAGTGQ